MGLSVVIVGLLMMVVFHEAAHFVAVKRLGMKATGAFFGFGPKPTLSSRLTTTGG